MEQTELFYFSKNDLMISVIYDKLEAAASYKCHRTMSAGETALIEKYIEVKILEAPHSIIVYFGEDDDLQETWNEFHSIKRDKNTDNAWKASRINDKGDNSLFNHLDRTGDLPGVIDKESIDKWKHHYKKEIHKKKELLGKLQEWLLEGISIKKISELKAGADEGFCFDIIGDILRDRNENHPEEPEHRMEELEIYVKEYNKLTSNKITIKSLLK